MSPVFSALFNFRSKSFPSGLSKYIPGYRINKRTRNCFLSLHTTGACFLTWAKSYFTDENPLGWEVEMHHDKLPVLPPQVYRHVPRLFRGAPGVVEKIHSSVISKLSFLIWEIDLGSWEYLNIPGIMIIHVNIHPGEGSNSVKRKIHLERTHASILPTHPLIPCKKVD